MHCICSFDDHLVFFACEKDKSLKYKVNSANSFNIYLFPSSKNSHVINEAKCKTFLVKMSFLLENKKSFSYQLPRT